MDWLAFIAAMTGHLAWPLAVTIILLTYRAPLAERIRRIRRMKYKDLEFDIGEEIRELSAKVVEVQATMLTPTKPAALPPARPKSSIGVSLLDQAKAVAEASPVAAVLLAWSALEQKIGETVARLGISPDPSGRGSILANIELLKSHSSLASQSMTLIQGLRKLRNELAHAPRDGEIHIKESDARSYIAIVEDMLALLDNAK